jgi:hypothetical protein
MTIIQLPPYFYGEQTEEQQASYDYRVALGDAEFRITLLYNEREDLWHMDLYTADDEPLILGQRMAIDAFLLSAHPKDGMPAGELMLFDSTDSGAECGFEDMGTRCEFCYVPPEDLPPPVPPGITITPGESPP